MHFLLLGNYSPKLTFPEKTLLLSLYLSTLTYLSQVTAKFNEKFVFYFEIFIILRVENEEGK